MKKILPCLFATLVLVLSAGAHEFWLAPARYVVTPGSRVHLGRWVGMNFQGERWGGRSARLEQLLHWQPAAAEPADLTAAARQADTLQTTVALAQPGTHLLALRTNDALITLPADKFEAYLKEEGLTDILRQRQQRKEQAKPGREAYRRCAKTLLLAGSPDPADTTYRRPVGHALEIIPEQNPYTLRPGFSLTVRVLADGRPLVSQPLQAWLRPTNGQPMQHFTLRTNQNGRTLLRLQHPSRVLLACVRMQRLPTGGVADWQSTWASLTFEASAR